MYEALQGELRTRVEEGYECLIIGDMNSHVRTPPLGIEGNRGNRGQLRWSQVVKLHKEQ